MLTAAALPACGTLPLACNMQMPCDASDVPVNEIRVLRVTIHANPLAQ
jgi:hypothetical protein